MNKFIKCTQCGICCLSGTCSEGKDDEYGFCIYLKRLGNGKTECELVTSGKGDNISIGKGCAIKHVPHAYDYYKEKYKNELYSKLQS